MVSLLALAALGDGSAAARTLGKLDAPKTPARASGRFSLLTYNVAGLPEFISQSDPVRNIPVISKLLNLYDVALVQEDFAYHPQLASRARHPYQSLPVVQSQENGMGDGLSVFSRLPFTSFERVAWSACHGTLSHGSDCLTPKGFTVSVFEVAPGVTIDLYNLHMDSGHSRGDVAARSSQAAQLLAHIREHAKGRPVVVAGDTNMTSDADELLEDFRQSENLVDSCRTLRCKEPGLIDRVLYRGTADLEIRATRFTVDSRFVKHDGGDLSDHKAVGVELEWRRLPETSPR
jgi:endonuclease/exonuclease/phosphatase family metal-dependent hydrolase